MNAVVSLYRKYLADTGQTDRRTDYQVTQELGNWANEEDPTLFNDFPDFGQEWGQIREANAPSLAQETGRAFKRATIGLGSTAVSGAALLTGSDYLKRKAAAIGLQASDPELASTIPTLEDIRSPRDAFRYGVSKVGEAAPSLIEAVGVGLVGAAAGSTLGPGGTLAGGVLGRSIIKRAIQSLATKALPEAQIAAAFAKGVPEVVGAVTKSAKRIAALSGGTALASVNSYLLNSGEVYSENDDRGTAALLGAVAALPDTILPALVLRRIFPGVTLTAGKQAAKELVGRNAIKAMEAAGIVGLEATTEAFQEGVNVVARNLKEGKDPLALTDDDFIRMREAGITGAVGGALASPAVILSGRPEEVAVPPPPAIQPPPGGGMAPPPLVPPASGGSSTRVTVTRNGVTRTFDNNADAKAFADAIDVQSSPVISPVSRMLAMTPKQQLERLAELTANVARSPEEEVEYQRLLAVAPRVTPPPAVVAPPVAAPPPIGAPPAIGLPGQEIEFPEAQPPVPRQPAPLPSPVVGAPPSIGLPGQSIEDADDPAAPPVVPVPIGPRDATISTGTGIATPFEEKMNADWAKQMAAETRAPFKLPKELAGAKSRYSYGSKRFTLKFDSDLDFATYILAQDKPSKSDAKYLATVMEQTGMTEAEARAKGEEVKGNIYEMAKGAKNGDTLRVRATIVPQRTAAPKGFVKKFGSREDGVFDIVDAIQGMGGVPRPATKQRGGEFDQFNEVFSGPAKSLVAKGKGGNWDTFMQALVGQYPEFEHLEMAKASEVGVELNRALAKRAELKRTMSAGRLTMKFEERALGGERKNAGNPVAPETLGVSTKFKVDSVPFEVSGIREDGSVVVRDGPEFGTQVIPPGTPALYPDKNSLKRAKLSTDFLPEEVPAPLETPTANAGEIIPTADMPFNLAGEVQQEGRSAVELAAEKAARDAALAAEQAKQGQMFGDQPPAFRTVGVAPTPEQLSRPTFEELRGQKVQLEAITSEGETVLEELDAADAWAETQKRRNVYQMLLKCLQSA